MQDSAYKVCTLTDVGITENVGDHGRIFGYIKERFSDFHVHEIDPNGKIIHLTDLDPPREVRQTVNPTDPELVSIVSEEIQQNVEDLQQEVDNGNRKPTPVEINVTKLDKQQRTKIHRWVANFGGLGSSTVDRDDEKFIVVEFATSKIRNARRPENRAKYTHCVLYKEGMDTSDAVLFLAKKLRLAPNLITYCGTKDKRAKTTQRICISNVDARRLVSVSKYSNQVKLGNFEYQNSHLSLGDLSGNHFRIFIKDVKVSSSSTVETDLESVISTAVSTLKEKGFINYYGLQRFGTYDVPTYEIGKALLQRKWDKVFDLILRPKPRDPEFMAKAKKIWYAERDSVKIVKLLPTSHRSIESNLFHGLSRHYDQRDCVSAFMRIPRNVRLLYVHSFQSYLWNQLVTFRIKKYGFKPVAGDIVLAKYDNSDQNNGGVSRSLLDQDLTMEITANIEIEPQVNPAISQNNGGANKGPSSFPQVKVLKDDDLGNYSIFDVLIPMPGTDISHPNEILLEFYDNLLLENGLTQECFNHYSPKQDAPRGAYRRLIQLPTNVSYKIISYSRKDNPDKLIPSDVDILFQSEKETKSADPNKDATEVKDKTGILVEFSLPSSSYATMALREVLSDSKKIAGDADDSTTNKASSGVKRSLSPEPEEAKKKKVDDETIKAEDAAIKNTTICT